MKTFLILALGCSFLGSLGLGLHSFRAADKVEVDQVAEYIPPSRRAPRGGYPGGATRFNEQPLHSVDV
ncbi:MAG: hypothetical protein ACFBSF_14620 [Leptolyngbyaceae cyanobacterium]